MEKKPRGLATLSPERRREIATMGARATHALGKAAKFTKENASEHGRKGGLKVSADREHMRRIGRIGVEKRRGK